RKGLHVVDHAAPLAAQEITDGPAKAFVLYPVGGPGGGGQEPAADLVLPLGTRLEAAQAMGDAVLDALVVTGLEMQAVELLPAAPVAAVQGVLAAEIDGAGHGSALVMGEHQYQLLTHGASEFLEEGLAQGGDAGFLL